MGGEGAGLAPRPAMFGPGQVPSLPPCSHTKYWDTGSWSAPITHPARSYIRLCIPGLQLVTSLPICISTAAGKAQPPSREAAGLLCWRGARPAGSKCVIDGDQGS